MINDVDNLWTESWNTCKGNIDLTNARIGGKATKLNPNKEDINFWQTAGPMWVSEYIAWRKQNPNWKIWIAPDGRPAIELELMPVVADVPIKMVIDRIFEVNGQLVIVEEPGFLLNSHTPNTVRTSAFRTRLSRLPNRPSSHI